MIKTRATNMMAGWICAIAVALNLASAATATLSYAILALYALLGRSQAIQALALSWLFSMISPGIAAEAATASLGRYAILAAASASVLLHSGVLLRTTLVSRPVLATLVLGLFLVAHSVLFSPVKDVSVLKAVSWAVAASTLLAAWSGLSTAERDLLARQIFGGLILLLLFSLPLLLLPLGYLRNGTGFQGVLAHPQAFGPAMGLLGAWAGSRMLANSRPTWSLVGLFGVSFTLVVLSEARTAGLAPLLGIVFAGITGNVLARRSIRDFLPGLRSKRVHLIAGLSLMTALLAGPVLSDRMDQYFSKRLDSRGLVDAYDASRGALIQRMWVNIQAEPWHGIGFGVASDPAAMVVTRDPILGLPTGAAIEKGVLPIAVLEELGAIGFLAVMVWLWMLVRRAARGGGMTALTVLFTALLLNMGEFVLFSPGGMGMLSLILIAWAASERRETSPAVAHA